MIIKAQKYLGVVPNYDKLGVQKGYKADEGETGGIIISSVS